MAYFKKVESYKTYEGESGNFHLDYNANSGGGQAFLGGSYTGDGGELHAARGLSGLEASFSLRFTSMTGKAVEVDLGTKPEYRYPITPRGIGSAQMKLRLGSGKARPSLSIPAALMLPETTTINMAQGLELSPLTLRNYWLRSMWLDCRMEDTARVRLLPKDYVFGGGLSKQGPYADEDGKPTGTPVFFALDSERRIQDIVRIADSSALPTQMKEVLTYFKRLYLGDIAFDHERCYEKTTKLMMLTSQELPTEYEGIGDPLPAIMSMLGEDSENWGPMKKDIVSEPRNLIFFGAPGTGKSHNLNKLAEANFTDSNIRRVTFYPDYTYSQFVGCFKPMTEKVVGEDGKTTSEISYRYVFGPFLETYAEAIKNSAQNYLLIVEEINRANPAAVFGDVFQLLDRDKSGVSTYDVDAPVEMRNRLEDELDMKVEKLRIPSNMFIWATMNSADQGVFPMDTAFKRRWSFRYIGIDDGENAEIDGQKLSEKVVPCGGRRVYWNRLRKAINDLMAHDCDINEDKLLGPFFLDPACLNDEQFADAFKDKVLMYLYEDAGKARRKTLFREKGITYSQLCSAFDREGELVFGGNFDDWGILADQEYELDDEQFAE